MQDESTLDPDRPVCRVCQSRPSMPLSNWSGKGTRWRSICRGCHKRRHRENQRLAPICPVCGLAPCEMRSDRSGYRPHCFTCRPLPPAVPDAWLSPGRSRVKSKHRITFVRAFGPPPACARCGFEPEHPCQIDIDHIDGNHANNDSANLQALCANCHRLKTRAERNPTQV